MGSKLDYVKNRGWIPVFWDGRILKIVRSYKAVIGELQKAAGPDQQVTAAQVARWENK